MVDLPTAVWSGTFNIMGVEVKCHTLSDGQRIIEAESMEALLTTVKGGGPDLDDDVEKFHAWKNGADV